MNYCTEIQYPIPLANKIKLFKPHGSLNWLYCKSCGIRIFGGDQKIAMEHYTSILRGSEVSCNYCDGGILSALIVPPSFFKELHNYTIRNILISLENHLKEFGVNEASTFFGFCSYHDSVVFSDIENKTYNNEKKQNFLFAYRACAFEYVGCKYAECQSRELKNLADNDYEKMVYESKNQKDIIDLKDI